MRVRLMYWLYSPFNKYFMKLNLLPHPALKTSKYLIISAFSGDYMWQAGLNAVSGLSTLTKIKLYGRKSIFGLKLSKKHQSSQLLVTSMPNWRSKPADRNHIFTSHGHSESTRVYWCCVRVCVCAYWVIGSGRWKPELTWVMVHFLCSQTLHQDALETLSSNLQDQLAILCQRLPNDGGRCYKQGTDVRMHFSNYRSKDSFLSSSFTAEFDRMIYYLLSGHYFCSN